MGPIYGTLLMGMSDAEDDEDEITLDLLAKMFEQGLSDLQEIVDAKVGDKTLVDTLAPATESLKKSAAEGKDFKEALEDMKAAAAAGRDSTINLKANFGRAARLGERSRGVLDAGATSCCIIITAMADGIEAVLV